MQINKNTDAKVYQTIELTFLHIFNRVTFHNKLWMNTNLSEDENVSLGIWKETLQRKRNNTV